MRTVLTALLVAALLSVARGDDAPVPPAPSLDVPERVYDAGKVDRGATLRHTFVLKNPGPSALSIDAKPG
jgi:hypothetical protein